MHGPVYPASLSMATAGLALNEPSSPALLPELSHLSNEQAALSALGLPTPLLERALQAARAHGTSVEGELIALGQAEEETYYRAVAQQLGLAFLDAIDPDHVRDSAFLDTQLLRPESLRLTPPTRPPIQLIVPRLRDLGSIAAHIEARPSLRAMLAITTPRRLRRAVWQAGAQRRLKKATDSLFDTQPLLSARITFWGQQGFLAGMGTAMLLIALIMAPLATLLAIHLALAFIHLAGFLLRLSAFARMSRDEAASATEPQPAGDHAPRPVYSILVALYREEAVVGQLVAALDRLDWPASRLDIKLLCEADDTPTLAALRALPLGAQYEIVEVPPSLPRTKPKALNYGLEGVRGEFVAVYDAEDRPARGQLEEAWQGFRQAPADVACLQAPIIITNGGESWLSALFALEYAALFRGLLPRLAAAGLPLPLGGTSNHFRTAALRQVGSWDPFNVTEDADLGIRLARYGLRTQILTSPTYEDAPTERDVWIRQRTRWFKGWLQTWLVCMRAPGKLVAQVGWRGFLTLQILMAGLLIAALSHPLLFGFIAYLGLLLSFDLLPGDSVVASALIVVDLCNAFGCYLIQLLLGLRSMRRWERHALGRRWRRLPFYWLIMSYAAWRAIFELRSKPFAWNKTPHRVVQTARREPPVAS
ncbi:glycosyl transferase [Xaviernesmea oryzae]|uniref:Glycosyl transferase n=1 Tax=Xaviernesmea oryzae TaxID=464029 RepID=A0A1Q9AS82_9HYPH|nr:glycosyltransferase family 2 protein [Xaviernesmea oryzae]OLP58303.1 glycosyl transferase [Xaviernesmea oryzae]SEL42797.1 Glycosyltransferase, catalytic subunit of cellulose synthase and poly-beta-1,6-N-acetylglucosamine synthase [Xaviernesmea oryzae]